MKNNFVKKFSSVLLVILMILPIFMTGSIPVSAASTALIISLENEEKATQALKIFSSEDSENPNHSFGTNVGKYAFDEEEQALSIFKSAKKSGSYFRFFPRLRNASILPSTAKYMIVKYKTNATTNSKFTVENSGGGGVCTLTDDISASNGNWVYTTPVDIQANESGIMGRFLSGSWNTLIIYLPDTTTESTYFYIQEIGFFSSVEDAETYIETGKLPSDATTPVDPNVTNDKVVPYEYRGEFYAGTHTYNGVTLPTSIYVPKTYSEDNEYGLIIGFHFAGSRKNDVPLFSGGLGNNMIKNVLTREGENFIAFAARCPEGQYWAPSSWSNGLYKYTSDNTSSAMSVVIDYVYNHILKNYKIDKNRVYVVGESMGGGGTWDFIRRCPELVTAAFPSAGYNDPTQAYNLDDNVKIWLNHGIYDKVVNVRGDRATYAVLKNLGRDVIYTEYDTTLPEVQEAFEYDPVTGPGTSWEHYSWLAAHKDEKMINWLLAQRRTKAADEKVQRFVDVPVDYIEFKAIKFVTDEGIFNGVSNSEFAPDAQMNRAMFVTVLGRYLDVDDTAYSSFTFKDILAGQYYTGYIAWANENKIVSGYSEEVFAPYDSISIAQACLILARQANFESAGVSTQLTLADYSDGNDVPEYAKEAMTWAISNGIYLGSLTNTTSTLSPNEPATRAQVAKMFALYDGIFGNN